jgi:hypothetical protein
MSGMGLAMMGTGIAEGPDRAMEAARRAISSPLLEGASVNGSRGVIINVTGGPDLSLVEVSEASLIVQEAAHEDANIIFGAVVDPELKGKVKITVIATGFGQSAVRPATVAVQTPVDMTMYAEHTRARAEQATTASVAAGLTAAGGADRLGTPRLSLARRALMDLPLAPLSSVSPAGMSNMPGMTTLPSAAGGPAGADPARNGDNQMEFDSGSPFDVPAFLRRQEG